MVKRATYFIVAILFFAGLFWLLSQPPKTTNNNSTSNQNNEATSSAEKDKYKDYPTYDNPDFVLYWKVGCPHCENVEKWLSENSADKKLKINYKETSYNQDNLNKLVDTVKQYCPEIIKNGEIGIPLIFDPNNKKCAVGDDPVIKFLSPKLTK